MFTRITRVAFWGGRTHAGQEFAYVFIGASAVVQMADVQPYVDPVKLIRGCFQRTVLLPVLVRGPNARG
jgi:hypothetical protein